MAEIRLLDLGLVMSADHFDVLRAERGFLVEPDGVRDVQRQGGAFGRLECEQLLVEFAALSEAVRESKDAGHLCFSGSAGALVEQGHACLDAIRGEEDVLPLCAHLLKQVEGEGGGVG